MGRFVKFEKERNQIPHLAAIVNATFHHATLSLFLFSVCSVPQSLFRGPQKGCFFGNKQGLAWWDRLSITLLCNRQCFPLIIINQLFHHFRFSIFFFFSFFCFLSIFTWSLSHKYEISPSLCFLFFVSALAMAAVLFELLDLVLCYFWPFCLSCGSVLFVFVHHCDIGCCFQSFDFDQIGGRLAIFLKKNRFLKRFLFAFKQ